MMKSILRRSIVFLIMFIFLFHYSYGKIYINGIEVDESDIQKYEEVLRYRAVADMVFQKSKVASLKYYEKVIEVFPDDFVSLARLSLIYSLREVPELSLYYGTNALKVYNKLDKKQVYILNYIELLVGLSLSYSKLRNEPESYRYLDESKRMLKSLVVFKNDYRRAEELVNYANNVYRKEFYNISLATNTNLLRFR